MSFGAVAGAVAGPLIGGLLGAGESGPSQTSTQTLDPEIRKYIYGDASTQGVLPAASQWFNQNSNGLSLPMIDALNRKFNLYQNPDTAQGYTNQMNLGQALLGGNIASNPFTTGQMSLGSNQVNPGFPGYRPSQVAPYQASNPNTTVAGPSNPFIYTAPAPTPVAAPLTTGATGPQYQGRPAFDQFNSDGGR